MIPLIHTIPYQLHNMLKTNDHMYLVMNIVGPSFYSYDLTTQK